MVPASAFFARGLVRDLVEHERRLSGPLKRLQAVTGVI